jgi:hypothetical protein
MIRDSTVKLQESPSSKMVFGSLRNSYVSTGWSAPLTGVKTASLPESPNLMKLLHNYTTTHESRSCLNQVGFQT